VGEWGNSFLISHHHPAKKWGNGGIYIYPPLPHAYPVSYLFKRLFFYPLLRTARKYRELEKKLGHSPAQQNKASPVINRRVALICFKFASTKTPLFGAFWRTLAHFGFLQY
jgi:hypothetical protein